MVSHGHINVNGSRVNIPSSSVSVGDKIGIRARSAGKPIFAKLDENWKTVKLPAWLKLDFEKKELAVEGIPTADKVELLFDVGTVLEFYSR
jgi:small subunit ribosomal protein S4